MAIIATLLASLALLAPSTIPVAEEGGWVALFDGTDLTGWRTNGEEKWVAEDGTIRRGP